MKKLTVKDLALIGVSVAVITVCAWIAIPAAVPFTLQTFAVFLVAGLLGGRRGSMAVGIYLLLGAVGVPVFAGFKGGPAALFNTTGGYLIGFLVATLMMWLTVRPDSKAWVRGAAMVAGLLACYAVGTAWFMVVYMNTTGAVGLATVLGWCVVPFIVPDLAKIALALLLCQKLRPVLARMDQGI